MNKGIDHFTFKPGEVDSMRCAACGAVCEVRRNVSGPISWAGAMAKLETPYDAFLCPNRDKPWHLKAVSLAEAIEDAQSPSVKALMKADLNGFLRERGVR